MLWDEMAFSDRILSAVDLDWCFEEETAAVPTGS